MAPSPSPVVSYFLPCYDGSSVPPASLIIRMHILMCLKNPFCLFQDTPI